MLRTEEARSIGWAVSRVHSRSKRDFNLDNTYMSVPGDRSVPNLRITRLPASSLWGAFIQSWQVFRPKSNIIYQTNRNFRLFFLTASPTPTKSSIVSVHRYFARWVDSYNFLFNLFVTHPVAQMISNKLFIEESLIFNWSYSAKNYKLFRYIQPFFIFADLKYGSHVPKTLQLFALQKLDFTITTDINNHNKLSFFLQKMSVFTVGLIPNNYSPWRVSYPIPAFSDSHLIQLYFIRWVLSLQSRATSSTYLLRESMREVFRGQLL